ncbi:hypothetical protein [Streptomyces sp. NPDC097610]
MQQKREMPIMPTSPSHTVTPRLRGNPLHEVVQILTLRNAPKLQLQ